MSEEELNEAIEYNLEYMEAMQSEEIFGGDYTSQVELKYANKSIDELQQENTQLKQQLKDKDEKISKIEKLTKQLKGSARYERCMDELDYILNIIKED